MKSIQLVVLFCSSIHLSTSESIIVNSRNGQIEGIVVTSKSGFEINTFLGIRYGMVSERFSKPLPVDKWDELKAAKQMPPRCMQYSIFDISFEESNDSEDCLFLNLFAPHGKADNGYPVMVYIHGGRYAMGSTHKFGVDGINEWIVPKGVVFIHFHYRLGIWGFFSTGSEDANGNWGLWDQSLLLKWVRDNVEQFGGNPNKITLFGQSAGSMSTSLQSLSPHSRDLFQNMILMSGSALSPWFVGDDTVNVSLKVIANVGCSSANDKQILACMRSKSNTELIDGVKKLRNNGVVFHGFTPRIDNDFFPETIEKLIEMAPPKSMIIGTTKDEMGLYTSPTSPYFIKPPYFDGPESFIIQHLRMSMHEVFVDRGFTDPKFLTDLAIYHYVDCIGSRNNGSFLLEAITEFLGDVFLFAPSVKESELRRKYGSKVWLYQFDYFNRRLTPGSFHSQDQWYLFKHHSKEYSQEELKIADYYSRLITNFAKFNNPTECIIDGIEWPHLDDDFPEQFLKIDSYLEVKNYYKRPGVAFWNELLPLLINENSKQCDL